MKARQLLAAILREGWVIARQEGSHRVLVRRGQRVVSSFHDRMEVPARIVARYARECGIARKGRQPAKGRSATMNGPVMKVTLDVFDEGARWFAEAREVCVVGDGETREAAVTKAKAAVLLLIVHELEKGARCEAEVQEVVFGVVDEARAA